MAPNLPVPVLTGRRKAAILCVSIGQDEAAQLFKYLSDEQVEMLTIEMARTVAVAPELSGVVLEEVLETAAAHGYTAAFHVSCALFAAGALITALLLRSGRLPEEDRP